MSYLTYLTAIPHAVADLVDIELFNAKQKHPGKFHNAHEGYAVLKEEVDELWDEIKQDASKDRIRAEAVQVAAMAIRIINELT